MNQQLDYFVSVSECVFLGHVRISVLGTDMLRSEWAKKEEEGPSGHMQRNRRNRSRGGGGVQICILNHPPP